MSSTSRASNSRGFSSLISIRPYGVSWPQLFLLKAEVDGAERKHIPDYLLVTDEGPVVVDVKPFHRLSKPEVAFTFGWTRQVVEVRGWEYEVWSEPPEAELENVRFLSGFRRDWLFDRGLVDELRGAELDRVSLRRAVASLPGHPEEHVRAAVYHLLWTHELTVDLDRPISPAHVLRRTV